MNLRRLLRPLSAALLTVSLFTVGVSPADAAPPDRTKHTPYDTGWGFK